MELLKIERIEKYYGNKSNLTKVIDGISFAVNQGKFVAITKLFKDRQIVPSILE